MLAVTNDTAGFPGTSCTNTTSTSSFASRVSHRAICNIIRQPHLVLPKCIGVIVQAVQPRDRDIVELIEGFHRRIQQRHLVRSIALRVRDLLIDELLQRIGEEALASVVQVQALDGVFLYRCLGRLYLSICIVSLFRSRSHGPIGPRASGHRDGLLCNLRRRGAFSRALRVQHLHADVHDIRVVLLRNRAEHLRVLIREAELRARQGLAGEERNHRALPVLLSQPAEHRLIPGRKLRRIIRHPEAHDREIVLILPERVGHRVVPALRRDRPVLRHLRAAVPDHLREHRRRRTIRLLTKRSPCPKTTILLRQRNIRQLHGHTVFHRQRRLQPLCPGTCRLRRTHPGTIAITDHQHTHRQLVLQPLVETVVQLPLE